MKLIYNFISIFVLYKKKQYMTKVSFQRGNKANYSQTNGAIFFAEDEHSIYLDGSLYARNYDSSLFNKIDSSGGEATNLTVNNKIILQSNVSDNIISKIEINANENSIGIINEDGGILNFPYVEIGTTETLATLSDIPIIDTSLNSSSGNSISNSVVAKRFYADEDLIKTKLNINNGTATDLVINGGSGSNINITNLSACYDLSIYSGSLYINGTRITSSGHFQFSESSEYTAYLQHNITQDETIAYLSDIDSAIENIDSSKVDIDNGIANDLSVNGLRARANKTSNAYPLIIDASTEKYNSSAAILINTYVGNDDNKITWKYKSSWTSGNFIFTPIYHTSDQYSYLGSFYTYDNNNGYHTIYIPIEDPCEKSSSGVLALQSTVNRNLSNVNSSINTLRSTITSNKTLSDASYLELKQNIDDNYILSNPKDSSGNTIATNSLFRIDQNDEFIYALLDSSDRILVAFDTETGSPIYGVGVPTEIKEYIDTSLANMQSSLTAGTNISIDDNTISVIDSPYFTGIPTVATAEIDNSTDQIATTSFVHSVAKTISKGEKGDTGETGLQGIGIANIQQTTTSNESGGDNVLTITKTDGTVSRFTVKNGNTVGSGITVTQDKGTSTTDVMSQAAITNMDYKLPSAFSSETLTAYTLSDYPSLDPRKGEGFTIVWHTDITSKRMYGCNYIFCLDKSAAKNYTNYECYYGKRFGVLQNYDYIRIGLLSNMEKVISNCGIQTTIYQQSHMAVSFEYETGNYKIYRNGCKLVDSSIEDYDYETVKDYLDECTTFRSMTGYQNCKGMAVFNGVLPDNRISEIYKNEYLPDTIKLLPANYESYDFADFEWHQINFNSGKTITETHTYTYDSSTSSEYSTVLNYITTYGIDTSIESMETIYQEKAVEGVGSDGTSLYLGYDASNGISIFIKDDNSAPVFQMFDNSGNYSTDAEIYLDSIFTANYSYIDYSIYEINTTSNGGAIGKYYSALENGFKNILNGKNRLYAIMHVKVEEGQITNAILSNYYSFWKCLDSSGNSRSFNKTYPIVAGEECDILFTGFIPDQTIYDAVAFAVYPAWTTDSSTTTLELSLKVRYESEIIECSPYTYRGNYFLQASGDNIPMFVTKFCYGTPIINFKTITNLGTSATYPTICSYPGQIGYYNSNVYIGTFDSSGKTVWKRINNA